MSALFDNTHSCMRAFTCSKCHICSIQHSVFSAALHIAKVAKSNSQTECPTVSITEAVHRKP